MYRYLLLFIVLFVLLSSYMVYPYVVSEEDGVEMLLERYEIIGADIVRIEEGDITHRIIHGYKDIADDVKLDETHHLRAESMSKTVAAMATLHLIDSTDMTLEDALYDHIDYRLPQSDFDADAITIKDILSHQSGITGGTDYTVPSFELLSKEAVLQGESSLHEAHMVREAGDQFEYSNQAYILLEFLIEENSEHTYESYVETNIFNALNVEKTTYTYPENTLITSYDLDGNPVDKHRYPFNAPAGMYSDANDIATLYLALINDTVLTKESADLMMTSFTKPQDFYALGSTDIGLGLFLDDPPESLGIFHGGEGSGSLSQAYLYPESGNGLIVMTNDKTAWEFIYAINYLYAHETNETPPLMSTMFIRTSTILYVLMSLLITISIHRANKITQYLLNDKLDISFGFTPLNLIKFSWSLIILMLWMLIYTIVIRNLLYTLSLQFTIVLIIFVIIETTYTVFNPLPPQSKKYLS